MAFGDNGKKVGGKLYALDVRGALVVKLPRARVDALVAAGKGTRFEPRPGRVMKEWLVVGAPKREHAALEAEARAFVGGNKSSATQKRAASATKKRAATKSAGSPSRRRS